MSDWIDDDIAQFKAMDEAKRQVEEAKRKQAEAALAANAALSAHLPALLERLISVIESDIKKLNSKFPSEGQKWLSGERIGDGGFRVTRNYNPTFSLAGC